METDEKIVDGSLLTDILANDSIPINLNYVLQYTKANSKCIDRKDQNTFRIIKFSSEWKFEDLSAEFEKLQPELYSNLFIFIFQVENEIIFGPEVEQNEINYFKILTQFSENRPFIVQLVCEAASKIFYKNQNEDKFQKVRPESLQKNEFDDFSSFINSLLDGNIEDLISFLSRSLTNVKDSSLILRFLRTLRLNEDLFEDLIVECAAKGSKFDAQAVLDVPFFLSEENKQKLAGNNSATKRSITSFLEIALEHLNTEILNFLTTELYYLLKELTSERQTIISTTAHSTNQIEILCNLVEFCDYPFPSNFDQGSTSHERLTKICQDRIDFHDAIAANDVIKIEEFIDNNKRIKIAYSPQNYSALHHAISSKSFEIFFKLKSLGYVAVEFIDFRAKLTDFNDRLDAKKYGTAQRRENIMEAFSDDEKPISILYNNSYIHNKRTSIDTKNRYLQKVKGWYKEMFKNKRIRKMFNVVSQCIDLMIVYDFENKYTEDIDFESMKGTLGKTYCEEKWIFIGAKFTNEKEEKSIKGTIAHELCHFALYIVFENWLKPYFSKNSGIEVIYKNILDEHAKWSFKDSNPVDDKCGGIISRVYRFYRDSLNRQKELIVRVLEILAYYGSDVDKIRELELVYKSIFEYYDKYVVPEFESFNMSDRENVRNFNKLTGIIEKVKGLNLEFSSEKDLSDLAANEVTIVTTNSPNLFLFYAYKNFHPKGFNLFDAESIIFTDEITRTWQDFDPTVLRKEFEQISKRNLKLNIFVNCSKGVDIYLSWMNSIKKSNCIFIISSITNNDEYREKLIQKLQAKENIPKEINIDFSWNDLNTKSQEEFLDTKVNFQGGPKIYLRKVLMKKSDSSNNDKEEDLGELNDIIDTDLLNLLTDKAEININLDTLNYGKSFELLNQTRDFVENKRLTEKFQEESIQEEESLSTDEYENFLQKLAKHPNFVNIITFLYLIVGIIVFLIMIQFQSLFPQTSLNFPHKTWWGITLIENSFFILSLINFIIVYYYFVILLHQTLKSYKNHHKCFPSNIFSSFNDIFEDKRFSNFMLVRNIIDGIAEIFYLSLCLSSLINISLFNYSISIYFPHHMWWITTIDNAQWFSHSKLINALWNLYKYVCLPISLFKFFISYFQLNSNLIVFIIWLDSEQLDNILFMTILSLDIATFLFKNSYKFKKAVETKKVEENLDKKSIRTQQNVKIESEKITQESLLENVEGKKYVLISDIAGTGKSWVLKQIAKKVRILNARKWIVHVDLKMHIEHFKEVQNDIEFADFMSEKILKPKYKFESKIFKKKYKNGETCIFFDGFDEIAPDCVDFVIKLAQSFRLNGGNQLWISTRDYFEVDLQEKLAINAIYKLKLITKEEGMNLIASLWIFKELEKENKVQNITTENIRESPNYEKYLQFARNFIQRIKASYFSIGCPQFYKMIAVAFENNKESAEDITGYKIYKKFVDLTYEEWSYNKGPMRKKANIEQKKLDFRELHEHFAMKGFYYNIPYFGDLEFDTEEWPEEEIIACGLLSKMNNFFNFSHQTFQEFFAANFIIRFLSKKRCILDDIFYGIFLNILTQKKFDVARSFLDESLSENSSLQSIEHRIPEIAKFFYENIDHLWNLEVLFKSAQGNLVELLIKVFKQGNYNDVKSILFINYEMLFRSTKNYNACIPFLDFLLDFLKPEDLIQFFKKKNMLLKNFAFYLVTSKEPNLLESAFKVLEERLSDEFLLKLFTTSDETGRNLIHVATQHLKDLEAYKFIWTNLQNFCKSDKFFLNLLRECDNNGYNIFQYAASFSSKEIFNFMINELERLNIQKEEIRSLLNPIEIKASKFLSLTDNLINKQSAWIHAKKHIRAIKSLGIFNFDDINRQNVIFSSSGNNEKFEFIDERLDQFSQIADMYIYEDTLKTKGQNLLQCAQVKNNSSEFHDNLWEILGKYFEHSEILQMIFHVDANGENLMDLSGGEGSAEISSITWDRIKLFITDEEEFRKHAENCVLNLKQEILKLKMAQEKNSS